MFEPQTVWQMSRQSLDGGNSIFSKDGHASHHAVAEQPVNRTVSNLAGALSNPLDYSLFTGADHEQAAGTG
jgi:hypothetical protein